MSMDQLMALVPIEAATAIATTTGTGRKSRWERPSAPKSKKSRFGPKEDKPYLPPPFIDLPPGLTPLQVDQFLREQRLDELSLKLEKGELEFGDPDIRPPSPPPSYDKNGNRTNTRDVRVRNAMVSEHQRLLEYVTKTVPGFLPPADFKPLKKMKKIIIPQEKYPEYNFMGLIIGPRGCNHKRLESESGAQISIRGRGTQKEGKKNDHQTEEEAAMPQHIHIAADTDEQIEKAVSLIEPLLNPFHPMHEEFKKKGLEQLALVNGVAMNKIEARCSVCGGTGHLSWECPDQNFQSFKKAEVKCALCGDKGHVTMDCKLARGLSSEQLAEIEKKAQGIATGGPSHFGGSGASKQGTMDSQRLDQEFSSFMSQLSGTRPVVEETLSYSRPRPGIGATSASTPPPGTSPGSSRSIPPPPAQPYDPSSGYHDAAAMMMYTQQAAAAYGYGGNTQDSNAMMAAMNSYMNPAAWAMMAAYYGTTAGGYSGYGSYSNQTPYQNAYASMNGQDVPQQATLPPAAAAAAAPPSEPSAPLPDDAPAPPPQ
ncbi:LOW QUALITY PROTEIN: uncharacterized protein LOC129617553 [Condylostylus longicornis]|uniref:LOW QUALITY PROTEIN: uncharacterized protein LOC129617553 n=1 Tax=Condylostylus longicornis TaxID=2530218 RepID=UPI00244DB45E|nr:LOW QUALITY PROTEIN: uncharacterized protein LOC129617553 [Condylostylus longicornis]